jgi:hypothetical protein
MGRLLFDWRRRFGHQVVKRLAANESQLGVKGNPQLGKRASRWL